MTTPPTAPGAETAPSLSPGRTPYSPTAEDTVQCPSCKKYGETDFIYCSQCGETIPDGAFAEAAKPPSANDAFRAMARRQPTGGAA